MAQNDENDLNTEFECLLQELECIFQFLNFREKSIATEWIKKLKKSNSSVDEQKLRLDFIEYFVNCWRCGVFNTEPFNKVPQPNVPLMKLRYMLPPDHKIRSVDGTSDEQRQMYVEEMFESMTDKGLFLEDQPVPRDGTFFLVVINQK